MFLEHVEHSMGMNVFSRFHFLNEIIYLRIHRAVDMVTHERYKENKASFKYLVHSLYFMKQKECYKHNEVSKHGKSISKFIHINNFLV